MHFGDPMRRKPKRFSVSLSKDDYKKLTEIGRGHRPSLSLQYLVNWSIQRGLLDRINERDLHKELANPLRNKTKKSDD
jgi:hypothetical protein